MVLTFPKSRITIACITVSVMLKKVWTFLIPFIIFWRVLQVATVVSGFKPLTTLMKLKCIKMVNVWVLLPQVLLALSVLVNTFLEQLLVLVWLLLHIEIHPFPLRLVWLHEHPLMESPYKQLQPPTKLLLMEQAFYSVVVEDRLL